MKVVVLKKSSLRVAALGRCRRKVTPVAPLLEEGTERTMDLQFYGACAVGQVSDREILDHCSECKTG